jgi:uncharacterized C2H2 Zn-finger protein
VTEYERLTVVRDGEERRFFTCPECSKIKPSRASLDRHCQMQHRVLPRPPSALRRLLRRA